MATRETSSRLELLQAWFQQRQLMEKEQKLLQIYDQQQQRAHQAAQRGSAGSNTSNGSEYSNSGNAVSHQVVTKTTTTTHAKSNSHGGKVRQMFDERRQTVVKGIDKSYPLEPLENKMKKANGTIPAKNRNKNPMVTRKNITSKRTSDPETNGNIKKGSIPTVSYHEEVTRETFGPKLIHQDEDIDKFYNLDHVKSHYNRRHQYIQNFDSRDEAKKSNQEATRDQLKNTRRISSKDNNANVIIHVSGDTNTSSGSTSRNILNSNFNASMKNNNPSSTVSENGSHSKNENKTLSRKQSSEVSAEIRQNSPTSTRSASAVTITTTTNVTNRGHNAPNSAKAEMTSRSRLSSYNSKLIKPSNDKNNIGEIDDSITSCKICGRAFAKDRIYVHEQICSKTAQKKRKVFDITNQRVKGTEMEAFVKKSSKKGQNEKKSKKPALKSNWRRKHEDFINAIRSAKKTQEYLAAGGKLSDLPPPPPSDTSDYIQCPHCGRKFNQAAAERHIPKCEHMLHNKPNPRMSQKLKR